MASPMHRIATSGMASPTPGPGNLGPSKRRCLGNRNQPDIRHWLKNIPKKPQPPGASQSPAPREYTTTPGLVSTNGTPSRYTPKDEGTQFRSRFGFSRVGAATGYTTTPSGGETVSGASGVKGYGLPPDGFRLTSRGGNRDKHTRELTPSFNKLLDALEAAASLSDPMNPGASFAGRQRLEAARRALQEARDREAAKQRAREEAEAEAVAAQSPRSCKRKSSHLAEEQPAPWKATGPSYLMDKTPPEIRDKIYGYLLVSEDPIKVRRKFTMAAGRKRPEIQTAILHTCKKAAREGCRVLYSENHFEYMMRDPKDEIDEPSYPSKLKSARKGWNLPKATKAKPISKSKSDFTQWLCNKLSAAKAHNLRFIDFFRYGHLLRHIHIVLESNGRFANQESQEHAFLNILKSLIPSDGVASKALLYHGEFPIQLNTLTITIFPRLVDPGAGEQNEEAAFYYDDGSPAQDGDGDDADDDDDDDDAGDSNLGGDNDEEDDDGVEKTPLTMVDFFAPNGSINRALLQVNMNSLRIHVYTAKQQTITRRGRRQAEEINKHLETTLDMRYLQYETPEAVAEARKSKTLPMIDHIKDAQQALARDKSIKVLNELSQRIDEAVRNPEKSVMAGKWEMHAMAERRRQRVRAEREAMELPVEWRSGSSAMSTTVAVSESGSGGGLFVTPNSDGGGGESGSLGGETGCGSERLVAAVTELMNAVAMPDAPAEDTAMEG